MLFVKKLEKSQKNTLRAFPFLRSSAGQSLIEVSFATAVVSMVLVGLLSSVIQAMSNSRVALEQTKSTQYAQEVTEWLRQRRDVEGWGVFSSRMSAAGADLIYCLPALPADTAELIATGSGECTDEEAIADTAYSRQVRIEVLTADQIRFTVEVTRPGKGGTVTTQYQAVLSDTT